MPAQPMKWEKRYHEQFWKQLHRLTTYKQGNPQCAKFINTYIYDYFPKDVRARLEDVNPLINGRRAHKNHSHFTGELLDSLITHIRSVLIIMEAAVSLTDFKHGMAAKFEGVYNVKLPGFQ